MRNALALLFLWPALAWGQITGEKEYPAHAPVVLASGGDATDLHWDVPGAKFREFDGGKSLAVWARPGTYEAKLEVTRIDWDARTFDRKTFRHKFTIGKPGPVPPGPGPDPEPGDPFVNALGAAYAKETAPNKAELVAKLAALYRQGIGYAERSEIDTAGELFVLMQDAAKGLGVKGKVIGVQQVIQAELKRVLPTDPDAGIDPAKVSGVFTRVAEALGGLK